MFIVQKEISSKIIKKISENQFQDNYLVFVNDSHIWTAY